MGIDIDENVTITELLDIYFKYEDKAFKKETMKEILFEETDLYKKSIQNGIKQIKKQIKQGKQLTSDYCKATFGVPEIYYTKLIQELDNNISKKNEIEVEL